MYNNIIIVPYRNRESQLKIYIKNIVPLIKEYLPNTKIVIVEQGNNKEFNRGKVLNVAFKEYEKKTKYFITNDVDINPMKKTIIKYYLPDLEENIVKGILTSPCNTLGGVIKISSLNIHKVNGFPNDIWGWGAEDKALQNRTEYYNIIKETNLLHTNKIRDDEYFKTFDDINDRFTKNYRKYYTKYYKKKEIESSGLNNIDYNIIERYDINDYVELIKVDI